MEPLSGHLLASGSEICAQEGPGAAKPRVASRGAFGAPASHRGWWAAQAADVGSPADRGRLSDALSCPRGLASACGCGVPTVWAPRGEQDPVTLQSPLSSGKTDVEALRHRTDYLEESWNIILKGGGPE